MPYKDPEKNKESKRRWYQENKEKMKEYRRKYRQENKERISEYQQRYYERNKERVDKRRREYWQKNQEYFSARAKDRKRYLIQNGLCKDCGKFPPIGNIPFCETCYYKRLSYDHFRTAKYWEDLKNLFEKQEGICPYSGIKLSIGVNTEVDHIIPRSRGGENILANMQWVHRVANKMKWDLTEEEFKEWIACIYNGLKIKE